MSETQNLNTVQETPSDNNPKKKKKKGLSWLTILILLVDIIARVCFYVVYGPNEKIREWYIQTAISTGQHKYLAYIFYDSETINEVLNKNRITYVDDTTDPDLIKIVENPNTGVYANAYEREILEHDPDMNYKVITIDEDGIYGWITVIYQPQKLNLVVTNTSQGEFITEFSDRYNATVAINAGGFNLTEDYTRYNLGSIILDGKIFKNTGAKEMLVCLTNEGKLLLLNTTITEAAKYDLKWALYFEPFFIVNGAKTQYGEGSNPGGLQPRTAIGQRADGIVLLMTIEGRGGNGSRGANFREMTELFDRYSCINAANLDGGGSTMLAINGELMNEPISYQGAGERHIYDAIVYN